MRARDVLDPAVVESLRQLTPSGEPDVLHQVLTLFLSEVPKKIDALRAAVAAGDVVAVQRIAHSLKGSSGNIGAGALYDVCRRLDDDAKSGEMARLPPLLERVVAEYARVEREIGRLMGRA